MNQPAVKAEVYEPDESLPSDLRALRRFANLMDRAVRIPGTNRRVGLDASLGLIPGVGDAVAALFSTWVLVGALRHRVPGRKILRMVVNIGIDFLVGLIPVVGDIFDVFFTENVENVEMIIRYRDRARGPRTFGQIGMMFALLFSGVLLITLGIGVWLIVGLVRFSRGL